MNSRHGFRGSGFKGSGFKKKMNIDVHLSMMIGLAGLDSTCSVDLLYQDESCHVVCKGHWGEG